MCLKSSCQTFINTALISVKCFSGFHGDPSKMEKANYPCRLPVILFYLPAKSTMQMGVMSL